MSQYLPELALITLIAAVVNGALGYGFSSITVPLALLFLTNRVLNPALVLVEVALNGYVLWINRDALGAVRRRMMPIVWGLIPGVVIGTLIVTYVRADWLKLGTFTLLLPLILLQAAGYRRPIRSEQAVGYPFGTGAPAQEVVVTDQLDATRFDFSTFQLGPITFGERLVTPPPAASEWTTNVDLRPANNLIVRINARLDKPTGVLTWRFQSIDPATGQPTEDALAGFLPPNKKSPEGQGSLLFTVATKAGLQTGNEIRNGARIVFDVNAPIDTPVWLNTIDSSLPTSHVTSLSSVQPFIVFYVNWAGTDTGSGIEDYTVFVSENGGPYTAYLSETSETSGIFVGKPGKTYSFYSVARDKAGNVEGAKTTSEATTTTPNVVVNSVDDARFFVLQHYRDFFGRNPDPSGFDFWTQEIASCGANAACIDNKRTNVSQAFFLSIEFQQTGYLVFRFYKSTFIDSVARPRGMPRMDELLADTRTVGDGVIVGQAGWEQKLADNQQNFARAWVQRAAFLAAFPADMTAQAFVDKLFLQSEVTPTTAERNAAIAAFGAGGVDGRAAALRSVADSGSVYNKQYNPAFVLMQYIGYLRRNPNDAPDNNYGGFDFWLGKMNQFSLPGEDVRIEEVARRRAQRAEMVRSFIVAGEYRGRFAQP